MNTLAAIQLRAKDASMAVIAEVTGEAFHKRDGWAVTEAWERFVTTAFKAYAAGVISDVQYHEVARIAAADPTTLANAVANLQMAARTLRDDICEWERDRAL